jgi:monoamine oxidase
MTKLWLQFPEAFWEQDLERDWINFVSDRPGEWVQTLNVYKYLQIPVLLLFNIGNAAKQFEAMPDNQVIESAMKAIRCWYPEAPNPVDSKFSRWGSDPYAYGAWSFVKAGATPEDCETYFESDSTDGMVFFAGEATTAEMIGTVHGAYITGVQAAKDCAATFEEGSE